MTILGERESLPRYEQSVHPNGIVYVRYQDQIGLGPYESIHENIAYQDGLFDPERNSRKFVVTDGGIINNTGVMATIEKYITDSTVMELNFTVYKSYEEKEAELKRVRIETAQILARKINQPVRVVFENSFEIVHP